MDLIPESVCYDPRKDLCDKKFPKNFVEKTFFDEQDFPQYRRSENLKRKFYFVIQDKIG